MKSTTDSMQPWTTHSNALLERAIAVVMTLAGVALIVGHRHLRDSVSPSNIWGFLLGVVLVIAGTASLLLGGRVTITVEPRYRRIVISQGSLLRQTRQVIQFRDVLEFELREDGDNESGSVRYFVVARLRDGRDVPLFYGFFEGMYNEAAMAVRMQRLARYHETFKLQLPEN